MPPVIERQAGSRERGEPFAWHYIVTPFDTVLAGPERWDGVAQLWYDTAPPRPSAPHGSMPTDSFQERAEPYLPWSTSEYVIIDGSEHLATPPLTLNAPYPCSRSGFYKVTFLVKAKPGIDHDRLYDHWFDVHAANVAQTMTRVGGIRYVVNHAHPEMRESYAGSAELYFHDESGWAAYRETIEDDGMGDFIDRSAMPIFASHTQFVGID
jgi:hypothetical protein